MCCGVRLFSAGSPDDAVAAPLLIGRGEADTLLRLPALLGLTQGCDFVTVAQA